MLSPLTLPIGTTLDRFIQNSQDKFPGATGELSQLLRDIALAAKVVHREVNRAGLAGITGAFGAQNVQGEEQMKLDVAANIRFIRALTKGGEVCAVISEEEEDLILTGNNHAKYLVAIDPLDGSSNIDIDGPIGTIFSVYRRISTPGEIPTKNDALQQGRAQVIAGYILYGSSTMLVYTAGNGVNGFTYEQSLGEFFLSHPNAMMPEEGKIYSCNEGQSNSFGPKLNAYLQSCKDRGYSSRYFGALVADFHRSLLVGGLYFYPSTAKSPQGKLRLMHECNALSFIAEQAGGRASNGHQNVLDIKPEGFHQRVPFFIGSKHMVDEVESYLR
jgi:fructose-1,6-bisphosphatase I